MGRQAEVQAMLQHHYIRRMLDKRPGLFLANNLHTAERRTNPHTALNLLGIRRRLGGGPVMHQVAAKESRQLVLQQALFFFQQ
ncbi:hypothetical protein D9M68_617270 [compost metagenome]